MDAAMCVDTCKHDAKTCVMLCNRLRDALYVIHIDLERLVFIHVDLERLCMSYMSV